MTIPKSLITICIALTITIGLGACAALERTDIAGTQIAENVAHETEVAAIAATALGEQATHIAQVNALVTEAALVNAVNAQLLGTLEAIITPTPVLIQDDSVELASLPSSVQGSRLYVGTGVTDAVDNTGCITQRRISFNNGVQRIYATLVIYNLTVDTVVSIEWYREQELVFSESWVAPNNESLLCLWFDITTAEAQLLPGEWRAMAYADGFPAINPMNFFITAETTSP